MGGVIGGRLLPIERIERARDASRRAHFAERAIPACREHTFGPGIPNGMVRHTKRGLDCIRPQLVSDLMDCLFVHEADNAKLFSKRQANNLHLRQINWRATIPVMEQKVRPYSDIAERLKWHRSTVGLSQEDYAASIGVKRSAFSLWEAGTHRLSLDGALALRSKYALSLDFMYEGIDDALPMTLRNAWRDRP